MFKPLFIARCDFANGRSFTITQVKANGACRITDEKTGKHTHSHSIANAWKSVCFQGDMDWRTNRSKEV